MLILVRNIACADARFEQRQSDCKTRSAIFSLTLRANRTAVYLDEVTRNGESESETSMLSSRRAVGLTEAFKHVRQELRADALPGVRNIYFNSTSTLR